MHEQELSRRRLHRQAATGTELDHSRVAALVGVVDVEAVVPPVARREGYGQEALLATAHDTIPDIEKRPGEASVDEVHDPAHLLDRVEAPRLGWRRGDRRP